MTEDPQGGKLRHAGTSRTRLWVAAVAIVFILALLIVPPLISIGRYQSRIAQLISASLGRPVRLSSVELRMLPRPGFVLTNLVVEEDPSFGAEPLLHADSVTASIRFLPLWRGELQISRISVEDASLNLVHRADGRWNLDSLLRTAASKSGIAGARAMPLPYMEATTSRINIKNGVEKLPYSLVEADASLWQESAGDWHVRLRGQPSRTDVVLDLGDTGLVRLEATLGPAPQLRNMPLHLDVDWREAQLGQLTRLILGSDEGWRGDLTGELHVDGTVEAAQVKTRLRASGVHRAEFAPAAPMDFDATCGFLYRNAEHSMQNVLCNSPIGDGRVRLTGNVPAGGLSPQLTLELAQVPAQVALDALRTLRSNLDPSLAATGSISGKMAYERTAPTPPLAIRPSAHGPRPDPRATPESAPLHGSFTVDSLSITGNNLSKPIQIAKIAIDPAPPLAGQPTALVLATSLPAGGPVPLAMTARLTLSGFQMAVRGTAALPRLRELAQVAGIAQAAALSHIAGEPAALDFAAKGPWLPPAAVLPTASDLTSPSPASAGASPDSIAATLTFHEINWKADFLASPIRISAATLHADNTGLRWNPVAFSYGPVKGTATLVSRTACDVPEPCVPHFTLHFASLDADALQSTILGSQARGTMLSNLIARLKPSAAPAWPAMEGTIQADSFDLGPFTLSNVTAALRTLPTGAELTSVDASVLGGTVHGTGTLTASTANADKPAYKLEGAFTQLNPALVGQLVGMRFTGSALSGSGDLTLAGFTYQDFTSSAQGALHLDWRHGSVASVTDTPAPPVLARFDRFTCDATISPGAIDLQKNEVQRGAQKSSIQASIAFGIPAKVTFAGPGKTPTP